MRVTLFARVNTALNPYMLLYKGALERQGLDVHLEQEFNLRWLITQGKSCDAIHQHWIEATYRPSGHTVRHRYIHKLLNNRLVRPWRGTWRLITFSAALLLARLQGKIIVYTAHNLNPHGQPSRAFAILHRVAHRVILLLSHQVHVHNHYTRQVLQSTYGKKDGVTVIPHGNYIGCYPNGVSQAQARRQLALPDDAFVYLFLGLVRPYKGVEELIEAFGKIEPSKGWLLIAGRASDASYKKKIVHLSEKHPRIKSVLEFVPDEAIQLYMNACDTCVLPYKDLATSGAAILALSFGRPVIAPDIASFSEIITPETGLLYDPSQPDILASALQQAQQRPWSEMDVLNHVRQFDWDKLGPSLATLYQKTS